MIAEDDTTGRLDGLRDRSRVERTEAFFKLGHQIMRKPKPGPGQESVWDYPRPPRLESTSRKLRVEFAGEVIAATTQAVRVLETSHPPTYYIPFEDVRSEFLVPGTHSSFCEFKGQADYFDLAARGKRSRNAAWSYAEPTQGFELLKDKLAFYAGRVDACYVDEERVEAQDGDFYGGWATSDVVGPFKGGLGTWGW